MNSAEMPVTPINTVQSNQSSWRDLVGIVASIGCAIHCAAMPFVIAWLPALGLSFLADEAFHKWMALICFLIAVAAFLPGLRTHGSWLPVGIGSVGLVLITFAAFGVAGECCPSCEAASTTTAANADVSNPECQDCDHCTGDDSESQQDHEIVSAKMDSSPSEKRGLLSRLAPWMTPLGGMLLVSAHLLNRRYGCLCGCCVPDETKAT